MEDIVDTPSFALFDLVSGRPIPVESQGQAQTLQVVIQAALASLVFAGAYGASVGVTDPGQALRNLVSLPVVVLLAVGCALPPALVSWKVAGHGTRLADLFVSVVTGVFTATLVLACAAPLLALYYLTTAFVGAPLAMLTVTIALVLGIGNGYRAALMRRAPTVDRSAVLIPLSTMLFVLLLSLPQLIHLASPILPEETMFDHGVEWLLGGGR